jgi:hypothetical protein
VLGNEDGFRDAPKVCDADAGSHPDVEAFCKWFHTVPTQVRFGKHCYLCKFPLPLGGAVGIVFGVSDQVCDK